MFLAEDIARRAIDLRNQGADLQALHIVMDQRVSDLFRNEDAYAQTRELEEALNEDARLRRAVAEALAWAPPKGDSVELMLRAVDAARGKLSEPDAALFGADLDWNQWKKQPDLTAMQSLFEKSDEVRTNFARAVDAYPGKQHLKEIAEKAVLEVQASGAMAGAIGKALQQSLLSWSAFLAGEDKHFLFVLSKEYGFRERVARAIGYRSTEAAEVAAFATRIWRSLPLRCLYKDTRETALLRLNGSRNLGALRDALALSAKREPDEEGWATLESRLTDVFANDPMLASALWDVMDWPWPFAMVLREELRQIEKKRLLNEYQGEDKEPQQAETALDASNLAAQKKLFGLAFSGGGIRSATFNLGVLQKLSDFGLLGKVDYVSTVSGGGYIGAWLAAWIRENGIMPFQDFLPLMKNLLAPQIPDPRAEAQKPIRFLREFSNYLTPRSGSFSYDTWTLVAIYMRNVVLNQAILIAVLGTMLLLPRLMVLPMQVCMPDLWMLLIAILTILLAVTCMSLNMRHAVSATLGPPGGIGRLLNSRLPECVYEAGWIQILVVGSMLVSVYFGSLWVWRHLPDLNDDGWWFWNGAAVFAAFLSLLLSVVGGFWHRFRSRQSGGEWWWAILVLAMITVLCAGATVGLFHLYLTAMRTLRMLPSGVWQAEIWGPIILLAVLIIPGTLQVGLMGIDYPDAGREWLSRFRAVASIWATYWIALMSAAIYGPLLILTVANWSIKGIKIWISGLTLGWIITTIGGLAAGNSGKTGKDREGNPTFSWLQLLAKAGPPVFVVGLLLLIATLEHLVLGSASLDSYWKMLEPGSPTWRGLDATECMFLVLAVAGTILAWRVDINEFSMHHFYKNRLVRCYLGASNDNRRPNPFTGFDGLDDFQLSSLRASLQGPEGPYLGPYPIINATLNLSIGQQLAWQERKGTSFIFTPCFCGFDVQGWANATGSTAARPKMKQPKCGLSEMLKPHGFRKTDSYTQSGGPFLGTAMAISGAAANPNQGYNTSAAVSFLMTVFDVRLGWWLGNPRRDVASKLSSPRFGLAALISELLGMTDDETRFVNLSDGGHFDNMGLYELVRRRCSFILLCDAEQDVDYKFEGLGSAIRKCRVDFGALIEIDPIRIKPQGPGQFGESHCAVGRIRYLDGSVGTLVYMKASMTGDEQEDVMQYRAADPHFPHETTADQWFGESQFESYRALGYHSTTQCLSPAKAWLKWDSKHPKVAELFQALEEYWYPVNPNLRDSASKHTATLSELLEQLRGNPNLHALGSELFPGGSAVLPSSPRAATEEFYFSLGIIQLVEDLYFDFQLDRPEWFRDPRISGWRYLFKTWKSVPSLQAAWAASSATFRKDFQLFWDSL